MKKFNGGNVCFICDGCRVITGYESLGAKDEPCSECKGKGPFKSTIDRVRAMFRGDQ